MANLLWPRTISVRRQNQAAVIGQAAYGGTSPATESTVASGISAHIQVDRIGSYGPENLPASGPEPTYKIITKAIPRDLIRTRDIIVDDLGNRYQVLAPSWQVLSTTCRCKLLQAS